MTTSPSREAVPTAPAAGMVAGAARSGAAHPGPEIELRSVVSIAVDSGLADAASITVVRKGAAPRSVVTTDERARQADDLQYRFGEGPCLDAAALEELFVIEDMAADRRWPRWSSAAVQVPVGASISIPFTATESLGSLNLYQRSPHAFTTHEIETAKIIAAYASATLAHAVVVENLTRAVDSRTLIGQAQGILMERFKLTADQAFSYLAGYSQRHNTKLAVLAAELTGTGTLADLVDPTAAR